MQLLPMLNLRGVKRQLKSPSILGGVGWNVDHSPVTHHSPLVVIQSQIAVELKKKEEIPPILRDDTGVPSARFYIRGAGEKFNCICNMPLAESSF